MKIKFSTIFLIFIYSCCEIRKNNSRLDFIKLQNDPNQYQKKDSKTYILCKTIESLANSLLSTFWIHNYHFLNLSSKNLLNEINILAHQLKKKSKEIKKKTFNEKKETYENIQGINYTKAIEEELNEIYFKLKKILNEFKKNNLNTTPINAYHYNIPQETLELINKFLFYQRETKELAEDYIQEDKDFIIYATKLIKDVLFHFTYEKFLKLKEIKNFNQDDLIFEVLFVLINEICKCIEREIQVLSDNSHQDIPTNKILEIEIKESLQNNYIIYKDLFDLLNQLALSIFNNKEIPSEISFSLMDYFQRTKDKNLEMKPIEKTAEIIIEKKNQDFLNSFRKIQEEIMRILNCNILQGIIHQKNFKNNKPSNKRKRSDQGKDANKKMRINFLLE